MQLVHALSLPSSQTASELGLEGALLPNLRALALRGYDDEDPHWETRLMAFSETREGTLREIWMGETLPAPSTRTRGVMESEYDAPTESDLLAQETADVDGNLAPANVKKVRGVPGDIGDARLTRIIVSAASNQRHQEHIGGALYGPWMRYLILGSIIVSQIGFVSAYIIFTCPIQYTILALIVVFLPLVLFRDLAKLNSTALVADTFILVGLVYIFGSEISIIAERGIADVKMFNPKDFSHFVGLAVYSFEGIGMVIPITDAMRELHKLPKVLTAVTGVVLVLFGGAGTLAYLTFGSEVQTVLLVNLDVEAESKMAQSV
ncbi:Aa-trans domain-containing protein [Mycena chlorophos]|uniref:Aa-trans domain-containing protein n=1 Tax=Mycena chlorophos TaxID=658473 RepID=A0A8H6RZ08_MYCCL|nr:Aa-trans domain-containing protein [Mycena chlorophos]